MTLNSCLSEQPYQTEGNRPRYREETGKRCGLAGADSGVAYDLRCDMGSAVLTTTRRGGGV